MATCLLTWNPKVWQWEDVQEEAARVAAGWTVADRSSSGNTLKIGRGDRLFLIGLGERR